MPTHNEETQALPAHELEGMTMDRGTLKRGEHYNWIGQPERLIYMGTKHYPGDRRTWHQFALVDKPDVCWSEVLDSDLSGFEETKDANGNCPHL